LTLLFPDPDPSANVVDFILEQLIDTSKTRRQVIRELLHLELINSAKDVKKGSRGYALR
jgi:hypothetical protein